MAKLQTSSNQDASRIGAARRRDYAEFASSARVEVLWRGGFAGIGSRGRLGSSGLLPHPGKDHGWDGDETAGATD
jgi:hypothetical protein